MADAIYCGKDNPLLTRSGPDEEGFSEDMADTVPHQCMDAMNEKGLAVAALMVDIKEGDGPARMAEGYSLCVLVIPALFDMLHVCIRHGWRTLRRSHLQDVRRCCMRLGGERRMAEEKQFHFATETSLGYIEGDLYLEIEGNDIEGSFNALGVDMRLRDGHYEDGRFSGRFSEVILFTPVEGTIEGQIEGDECTLQMTTASGTRVLHSS